MKRYNRLIIIVLAACCVTFTASAYIQYRYVDLGGETDAPAADAPDAPPPTHNAEAAEPFSLPPLANLNGVLERPLFSESRRPPVVAPPGQAPREIDSIALLGIVIAMNDRHILIQGDDGKAARIHEGEAWSGWTVESILPDRVVFSRAGEKQELRVKEGPSTQAK